MFTDKKTEVVISGADTIEVRFGDDMEFDDFEQEEPHVLYENEIYEGDFLKNSTKIMMRMKQKNGFIKFIIPILQKI